MDRRQFEPRDNWLSKIEGQGLVYDMPEEQNGKHYWMENAGYVFGEKEVQKLEAEVENLHTMCLEAAKYMATGEMGLLGLSEQAFNFAKESLENQEKDFYGRFDVIYDGQGGPIKMLEYNADTPTGIIEAGVAQWYWKEDRFPFIDGNNKFDQWNNLYDAFIDRWKILLDNSDVKRLHFACVDYDTSGEDLLNISFLRDTAVQAGWETIGMTMNDIGWDGNDEFWFDHNQEMIFNLFKLYPWEYMVDEDFGYVLMNEYDKLPHWYEPAWKMFLSNKSLCAALWRIYPNHPNLLESYTDGVHGMKNFVTKPIFGREGDGIEITSSTINVKSAYDYSYTAKNEETLYQEFCAPPKYKNEIGEDVMPVLGLWVVDGKSVGCGIRESTSYITDFDCQFVPNLIEIGANITMNNNIPTADNNNPGRPNSLNDFIKRH